MPLKFISRHPRSVLLGYLLLAAGLIYAITTVQTVSSKADANQVRLIKQNRKFITSLCVEQTQARSDANDTRKALRDLLKNTLKLQMIARSLQPPLTPALAKLYTAYDRNLKNAIDAEKQLPKPGCLKFIESLG